MGYIKSLEQQMLFISQGFLPSCLNFGYKKMFGLVDVLQIAVVIYWVGFLLVLIFMQKFRYLCLTKSIVLPFSTSSSGNNWTQNKLIPMAFSVVPLFFLAIAFVVLISFSWLPLNIFQIWSKLAGYQEFALGFEPIRNWEMPQFCCWKILIKQMLFFQLLVYPGKMLQYNSYCCVNELWREKKIEKIPDCPKLIHHQTVVS